MRKTIESPATVLNSDICLSFTPTPRSHPARARGARAASPAGWLATWLLGCFALVMAGYVVGCGATGGASAPESRADMAAPHPRAAEATAGSGGRLQLAVHSCSDEPSPVEPDGENCTASHFGENTMDLSPSAARRFSVATGVHTLR